MISKLEHIRIPLSVNIITIFLILALLRLLPFNFYISMLVGHDVVIDNKEGNAINFINYISATLLLVLVLIKFPKIKAAWIKELWPYFVLVCIYAINFFLSPYANPAWLIYQLIFIATAALLHVLVSSQSAPKITKGGFHIFIAILIIFLVFATLQLYTHAPWQYVVEEFNDSFVNSLNIFGVMKQYFGYVAGFLLCYGLFVIRSWPKRIIIILLVLSTAFGIRSFIVGMYGVLLLNTMRSPFKFLMLISLTLFLGSIYWLDFIENIIFDTRFYAYMNAWDILLKYPFGVGLGGYPVYTEIHNMDLFAAFYNTQASLDFVPNAPESDYVHLFGSLGFAFGLLHLLLQLLLIIKGVILQSKLLPFEKCMFFYFVFMTFFGISEDTMFTVSYWIFFGITSGFLAIAGRRENGL